MNSICHPHSFCRASFLPRHKSTMSYGVHGGSMLNNLLIKIAFVKLNLWLSLRGMYDLVIMIVLAKICV